MTERRTRTTGVTARRTEDTLRQKRITVFLSICTVLGIALIIGLMFLTNKLTALYNEQCRVTDPETDIVIVCGKTISEKLIVNYFGLTNNANLAELDFATMRERLLQEIAIIRDVKIERRLPNRVTVEVFEREPIAHVAQKGDKRISTRVADREGVVFSYPYNGIAFPIIREAEKVTKCGHKLSGREAAALRLVEAAGAPEFVNLRILDVDTSPKDYLLLTLGDYLQVKFAWEDMDEATNRAQESLINQLTCLMQALASNYAAGIREWDATDYRSPVHIYGNDPEKIDIRKDLK